MGTERKGGGVTNLFLKDVKNVVIKIGTSVLTSAGKFDRPKVSKIASEIAVLLKKNTRVAVVSSGAIGAGMTLMKLRHRPSSMQGLQAAAAVGQRYLMQCYEEAFSQHGFSTAQVLLTWDDLSVEKRFMNAKRALREIQRLKHVPVINENDTVATDEIRFGDNDRLSSLLAILLEADLLVILSDTNGLYADGKKNDMDKRIRFVEKIDDVFGHVSDQKTVFTVGGMRSKLNAIRTSVRAGIPVFLADGRATNVLTKIFNGEDIGTFFAPIGGQKSWIRHFKARLKERVR